jgi:hypothetical protein
MFKVANNNLSPHHHSHLNGLLSPLKPPQQASSTDFSPSPISYSPPGGTGSNDLGYQSGDQVSPVVTSSFPFHHLVNQQATTGVNTTSSGPSLQQYPQVQPPATLQFATTGTIPVTLAQPLATLPYSASPPSTPPTFYMPTSNNSAHSNHHPPFFASPQSNAATSLAQYAQLNSSFNFAHPGTTAAASSNRLLLSPSSPGPISSHFKLVDGQTNFFTFNYNQPKSTGSNNGSGIFFEPPSPLKITTDASNADVGLISTASGNQQLHHQSQRPVNGSYNQIVGNFKIVPKPVSGDFVFFLDFVLTR